MSTSTLQQQRFSTRVLFLNSEDGMWTPNREGFYKFDCLVLDGEDIEQFRQIVAEVVDSIPYVDEASIDGSLYGYMGDDERAWTIAKILNGGKDPVLNPNTGRYFHPIPMNRAIGDGIDYLYFDQFDAPRITGVATGENLANRTATVRFRFKVIEHTGSVVCNCDYIDVEPVEY